MAIQVIVVPDMGGAASVEVIEICVAAGDSVDTEQSLIVLETDKASMEVPSPVAGKVVSLNIKEGDTVSEGDAIIEIDVDEVATTPQASVTHAVEQPTSEPEDPSPADVPPVDVAEQPREIVVSVPDMGGADSVDIIEICVALGDEVNEGDSLIVLETDKASMEVPSPVSGKVLSLSVSEGDKVSEGDPILSLMGVEAVKTTATTTRDDSLLSSSTASAINSTDNSASAKSASAKTPENTSVSTLVEKAEAEKDEDVYAGPSVRKLARQLGVDLSTVKPSGPRSRYTKNDIRTYVKDLVANKTGSVSAGSALVGSGIAPIPEVDFSLFGAVDMVKMSKIKKITAANMTRNWLNVPHVTQFDDADITELEAFRKDMKAEAEKRGTKLTPLIFLLKACAAALRYEPAFNASLHADGEHIVHKSYIHIGVAVATAAGLVVPVLRDVDKKGLWELADEAAEMAKKARDGKLLPRDMQGACFTISSLGAMGGNGFTPIINAPEVAILGVSKAQIKPLWNGSEFVPRQMLPLSVSYDHRAINGADAGNFFTYLVSILGDIRQLLL